MKPHTFTIPWIILCLLTFAAPAWSGEFAPAMGVVVERTWTMTAYGESIGMIRGIIKPEKIDGKVLVKYDLNGMVGLEPGVQMNSHEIVWAGPDGIERFKGRFQVVDQPDVTTMDARLNGDSLEFELRMKEGDPAYKESFVKDLDYHWSTAYIDVDHQNFVKGKTFNRKILDIYELKTKDIEGVYYGTEKITQSGKTYTCHKIKFDYGDVKGIFWMAQDDMGWFLVKEEAETHGVPFQMHLGENTRRKVTDDDTKSEGAAKPKDEFGF